MKHSLPTNVYVCLLICWSNSIALAKGRFHLLYMQTKKSCECRKKWAARWKIATIKWFESRRWRNSSFAFGGVPVSCFDNVSEACSNCIVCLGFYGNRFCRKRKTLLSFPNLFCSFHFSTAANKAPHTQQQQSPQNGVRQFAVKSKSIFHLSLALDLLQLESGEYVVYVNCTRKTHYL